MSSVLMHCTLLDEAGKRRAKAVYVESTQNGTILCKVNARLRNPFVHSKLIRYQDVRSTLGAARTPLGILHFVSS